MWAAIFGILASLPQLLSLMEKFAGWLADQIDQAKKNQSLKDMNDAIDKAKETKDTSALDQMFDSSKEVKK